ncbi:MAG: hypothetical protein ACOCRX_01665 [Candidatus Woesearchaeota archaeon]
MIKILTIISILSIIFILFLSLLFYHYLKSDFLISLVLSINVISFIKMFFFFFNINQFFSLLLIFTNILLVVFLFNIKSKLNFSFKFNNFKPNKKLDKKTIINVLLLLIPLIFSSYLFLTNTHISLQEDDLMYHLPLIREISNDNYQFDKLHNITNNTFILTYRYFPLLVESLFSLFYNTILFRLLPLFIFLLLIFSLYKIAKYVLKNHLKSSYELFHNVILLFIITLPILFIQSNRFYVDLFLTLNSILAIFTLFKIYKSGFTFSNSLTLGIFILSMNLTKMSGLTFTIPIFFMLMYKFDLKRIKHFLLIGSFYFLSSIHYLKNITFFGTVSGVNIEELGFFNYIIKFFSGFLNNINYSDKIFFLFILALVAILIFYKKRDNLLYFSSIYSLLSLLMFIMTSIISRQKLIMIHNFYFRYLLTSFVLFSLIVLIYLFESRKYYGKLTLLFLLSFFILLNIQSYYEININTSITQKNLLSVIESYPLSHFADIINSDQDYSVTDRYHSRVFTETDRVTYFIEDPFRTISFSKEGMAEDIVGICQNNNYMVLKEEGHYNQSRAYVKTENHILFSELEDYNYEAITYENNYNKYTLIICQN